MKDQREAVFARIKEALRVPAPHRHSHLGAAAHGAVANHGHDDGLPSLASFRSWLPQVGTSYADQVKLFSQNSAQLKTELVVVKSTDEIAVEIQKLADQGGWKRLASHRQIENVALTDVQSKISSNWTGEPILFTEQGYDIKALETADAAITGCDALVAQTGSVLVTNYSAGGRGLSVLPPHHIVIATAAQMVPDLTGAFEVLRAKYKNKWPSFMSFITGPSRTGDIERILVLGAHGPKRLTIFLLE